MSVRLLDPWPSTSTWGRWFFLLIFVFQTDWSNLLFGGFLGVGGAGRGTAAAAAPAGPDGRRPLGQPGLLALAGRHGLRRGTGGAGAAPHRQRPGPQRRRPQRRRRPDRRRRRRRRRRSGARRLARLPRPAGSRCRAQLGTYLKSFHRTRLTS